MNTPKPVDCLRIALWFGLVIGLVEAAGALLSSAFGRPVRVNAQILWIAPTVDAVLFLLVGAGLTVLGRVRSLANYAGSLLVIFPWGLAFLILQLAGLMSAWAQLVLSLGLAVSIARLSAWTRLPQFVQRTLVPVLLLAVVAAGAGLGWAPWRERSARLRLSAAASGSPNVILITLDALRADHVSAYGYARATTPNLDHLASRGVLFENAFANSSWTLPSHGSLLTGRYPDEHGADWRHPMNARNTTLAEFFAARGYLTAAFAANTSYVAPEWGLGRGFSRFEVHGGSWADGIMRTVFGRRLALNILPRLGYFDVPGRKSAARLDEAFLSWLDDRGERPFFALLNYFDVHDPYLTVEPFRTRYAASPARGDVINFQFQPNAFRRKPVLSAQEIQAEIDAYDGCLAFLDAELGRLLAELQRRGIDRNTLVVITSDHGESFGNHDLFGHGNSLYLESLHVPLLMVWPGQVPAGIRVSQLVGLERVATTIAGLVGGESDRYVFPGQSLALAWQDQNAAEQAFGPVLSEVSRAGGGPSGYPTTSGTLTSLITQDWHLVVSTTLDAELYAWPRDREERVNLAASQEGQRMVAELTLAIEQMRARGTR